MTVEQQAGGDVRRVAVLVAAEGIEQVELTEPMEALRQAGWSPEIVSAERGEVQAFHHLDRGDRFPVDRTVAETDVAYYRALVLPGGVANGDTLRADDDAVSLVGDFMEAGKPVAAVCHAIWALVEADLVRGRTLTSWPSLRTDVENAGGTWVDREVVVYGNLITSRKPDDLPAFNGALLSLLAEDGGAASGEA